MKNIEGTITNLKKSIEGFKSYLLDANYPHLLAKEIVSVNNRSSSQIFATIDNTLIKLNNFSKNIKDTNSSDYSEVEEKLSVFCSQFAEIIQSKPSSEPDELELNKLIDNAYDKLLFHGKIL